MKDRYVDYVNGKILVIGIHMIERANNAVSQSQALISNMQYILDDPDATGEEKAVAQIRLDRENAKLPSLQAKADQFNAFNKIAVADADWQEAGCPQWWVDDNGTIRKPTQAEKEQRIADREAAILAAKLEELYQAAMGYQNAQIDINMKGEMDKAEALQEDGRATAADLPLTEACRVWLQETLWTNWYYVQKGLCMAGEEYSTDPSTIGPVPSNFTALRTERKTFLAGV